MKNLNFDILCKFDIIQDIIIKINVLFLCQTIDLFYTKMHKHDFFEKWHFQQDFHTRD